MNLLEMKEQLIEWMNDMKHGYRDFNMYMEVKDKGWIKIVMFTHVNKYTIMVRPSVSNFRCAYLGATASSRTSRAGESWTRGNDLTDGKFCRETWIKILGDIVGYELVKIHRPIQHKFDCAVHNEPACPKGKCNCSDIFVDSDKKRSGHVGPCRPRADDKDSEETKIKKLIETPDDEKSRAVEDIDWKVL